MYQQQGTVVTSTGMQPAVVMATAPQSRLNTNTIMGLSITQVVLGVVVLGLGIGVLSTVGGYWVSDLSGGIWGGIWIIITGIIGICASKFPNNSCLVGTTLAFNIIATIVACIDGIIFLVGVVYASACSYSNYSYYDYYYSEYKYRYSSCSVNAGIGSAMFGVLMTAMGIEFFIALITAIYCCKGCCGTTTSGVIVQQPQYIITSSAAGHMGQQPVYNAQSMPYNANYPQQYQQQPYTSQAQQGGPGGNTNVSYTMNPTENEKLVQNEAPPAGYNAIPPTTAYNAPPTSDYNPPPYSQY